MNILIERLGTTPVGGAYALYLASFPDHIRLLLFCIKKKAWWRKSNFLGLLPECGKDQWDCKIINYYAVLLILYSVIPTFFLNGYVTKRDTMCDSRRKLTWSIRRFFLWKGGVCGGDYTLLLLAKSPPISCLLPSLIPRPPFNPQRGKGGLVNI